jgi:hypothetical protein
MYLEEAAGLLGESARYFICVYEHFNFTKQQFLKDYLDFIIHEPVEWLKAFPEQLKTKSSFAKPKSALIKLIKCPSVVTALGADYLKNIHDIIWTTFKQSSDEIIRLRQKSNPTVEHSDDDALSVVSSQHPHLSIQDDLEGLEHSDAMSLHSVKNVVKSQTHSSNRIRLMDSIIRTLVQDYQATCPALANVTLQLLDALHSDTSNTNIMLEKLKIQ